MKKKISITINEVILKNVDSLVDNLFIRNRSQAIEFLLQDSTSKNKTVVILAGGPEKGLKIKKDYYPTIKFKGISVIERAVKTLRKNNFKNIYVIARQKVLTKIFELLQDGSSYGVKVNYIEEKESSGTAGSLKLIKGKINSTFLVVYSDIIFEDINIQDMWDFHLKNNSVATLMLTTFEKPSQKGVVELEGTKIVSFNQKPKKTSNYIVFSPLFIVEPEILEYPGANLEKNIFTNLAKKGFLSGYSSKKKEIHIHDLF